MRNDVLSSRELADSSGSHLHIDLPLHLPCGVFAGARKELRWSAMRYLSHQHKIRLAEPGGTTTDSTWTGDGKRRIASAKCEGEHCLF
jgi:hypothetical protein